MLTSNLTLVSSGTPGAKPGATGSKVFTLVATPVTNLSLRRITATAATTPQVLSIGHTHSKSGFAERVRSVIRYDFTRNDTDPAVTGGIVPSFGFYTVLDRPVRSNGYITSAHIYDGIGWVADHLLVSGNVDAMLNEEL